MTLPKFNIAPEKLMVGRLPFFLDGIFSGACGIVNIPRGKWYKHIKFESMSLERSLSKTPNLKTVYDTKYGNNSNP